MVADGLQEGVRFRYTSENYSLDALLKSFGIFRNDLNTGIAPAIAAFHADNVSQFTVDRDGRGLFCHI